MPNWKAELGCLYDGLGHPAPARVRGGGSQEVTREAPGMFESVEVVVDDEAQISVEGTYGHGRRSFHWLTPEQARGLALTLLAAAMDAEAIEADTDRVPWNE